MSQVTTPLEKRGQEDQRNGEQRSQKRLEPLKHEAVIRHSLNTPVIRTRKSGVENYVFLREILIVKCVGKKKLTEAALSTPSSRCAFSVVIYAHGPEKPCLGNTIFATM